MEGRTHKIAIWNGIASSQMVELGDAVECARSAHLSTHSRAAGGGAA